MTQANELERIEALVIDSEARVSRQMLLMTQWIDSGRAGAGVEEQAAQLLGVLKKVAANYREMRRYRQRLSDVAPRRDVA